MRVCEMIGGYSFLLLSTIEPESEVLTGAL